jgi:hypothetical protein
MNRGNIEHPTSNAEHPMNNRIPILVFRLLDVGKQSRRVPSRHSIGLDALKPSGSMGPP